MNKATRKKVLSVLSLAIILCVQNSFAAPPTSLYNPGETTNPSCAPGSANCDVNLSSIDDQTLSFSGNYLVISDGNNVDLSAYLDNTDSQNLSITGGTLSISGGNSVNIGGLFTDTNTQLTEAQVDTFVANNGYLTGYTDTNTQLTEAQVDAFVANNGYLTGYTDTDDQTLSFSGNYLVISDGNNVDLSSYLDNTDSQNLSITGGTLSISGGNSVTIPSAINIFSNNGTVGSSRTVGVTDTLNFDNDTLFIDGTNNVVGIGTSSVAGGAIMHIKGSSEDMRLDLENDARRYSLKVRDKGIGEDSLVFADETSSAERLVLDKDGNFSIGGFIPEIELAVGDSNTGIDWIGDGDIAFVSDGNKKVRIDSNGVAVNTNSGATIDLAIGDGDTGVDWLSDGDMVLRANNDQQVRINPRGVSINTVDAPVIDLAIGDGDTGLEQSSDGILNVYTNNYNLATFGNNALQMNPAQGSSIEGGEIKLKGAGGAPDYTIDNYHDAGADDFRILENGVVRAYLQNSVNGWQTPSDRRLKENIKTLSVLENISELRGASYDLKDSKKAQIGVIAQEIQKVFPEAVSGNEDTGMLGVSYDAIAAIALQGVRELYGFVQNMFTETNQKIMLLEKENNELKARLDALEKKIR